MSGKMRMLDRLNDVVGRLIKERNLPWEWEPLENMPTNEKEAIADALEEVFGPFYTPPHTLRRARDMTWAEFKEMVDAYLRDHNKGDPVIRFIDVNWPTSGNPENSTGHFTIRAVKRDGLEIG